MGTTQSFSTHLFYLHLLLVLVHFFFHPHFHPSALGQEMGNGEESSIKRFVYTGPEQPAQPEQMHLVVEFWDDDLIHFEYSTGRNPPSPQKEVWVSPMVAKKDYTGPKLLLQGERNQELATGKVKIEIDERTLCVKVYKKRIRAPFQYLHTVCPQNLHMAWKGLTVFSPQTQNVYGLGQYFSHPGTADGDWMGRIWDPKPDSHGNKLWPFSGGANSHNMFPVAYALGHGGHHYALFLDQVYKQMWSFQQNPWKIDMWGDQIRWFLLVGDEFKDLRRSYMELTGRPPVPPQSAFGLWISEFGYESWEEIEEELQFLEKHHFPVDGFALDIQWFGGRFMDSSSSLEDSRFGSLTFDSQNFPRATERIRQWKQQKGLQLMTIEESYISKYRPEHSLLEKKRYLAHDCHRKDQATFLHRNPWWGVGGMLDWTHPKAGSFWHDLKRRPLVQMGINFHWIDLGEPEMYEASSCYFGFPELGKNQHGDIHNVYNLKWAESIHQGYQRHQEKVRPFILSRSGTSGLQRYGTAMWSGDIGANMGALTAHLQAQMQMSFSGVDYYGSDIGGFHRRPEVLDGDPHKLFTQWFASSALFDVPIRSHVWNLANNLETSPAKMGHRESNLQNLLLRYELFPYYYTHAHLAHTRGDPLIPPLVYEYPEDLKVRRLGNIKLIGRDLLAAVVANYQETHRDVYLPEGKWVNYHTLDWFESKGETVKDVPVYLKHLFRLPLFVRAGALLPLLDLDEHQLPSNLTLRSRTSQRWRVFPHEQETSFTLIEDDGISTDYLKGKTTQTTIKQKLDGSKLDIEISPSFEEKKLLVEVVLPQAKVEQVHFQGHIISQCPDNEGDIGPCWLLKKRTLLEIKVPSSFAEETKRLTVTLANLPAAPASAAFLCHQVQTRPGQSVYLSGNLPQLGNFAPDKAVKLEPHTYPTWMGYLDHLPAGKKVQWKCLTRTEKEPFQITAEGPTQEFLLPDKGGYGGIQESWP